MAVGRWHLAVARWPVGPLARWSVGPLARWPVHPLTRWPVGPLGFGLWALALGPRPLALDPWPLGLGAWGLGLWAFRLWALAVGQWALAVGPWPWLNLPNPTFSYLLFFFSSHTEKLLTTKHVGHFQGNPGVWLATEGAGCHAKAAMCVRCPCG